MLDFAQVDSWRAQRTGFPEVIFGGGKSGAQVAAIMAAQARNDQVVLATRISPEVGHALGMFLFTPLLLQGGAYCLTQPFKWPPPQWPYRASDIDTPPVPCLKPSDSEVRYLARTAWCATAAAQSSDGRGVVGVWH